MFFGVFVTKQNKKTHIVLCYFCYFGSRIQETHILLGDFGYFGTRLMETHILLGYFGYFGYFDDLVPRL